MKREYLFYDAFVIEDNKAWFFADNLNGLFEINLETFQTKFLGFVPGEKILDQELYYNMIKVEEKLILFPAKASSVAIYNLSNESFHMLKMNSSDMRFYGGAAYKKKVFMLGYNSPLIAVIDLKKEEIRYIRDYEKWIYEKKIFSERMYFRRNNTVVNGEFFSVSCNYRVVLKINMENESVSFYEIKEGENGLRSICYDGNTFWISEWNRASVFQWDEKSGVIGKYEYSQYALKDFRTADMFYTDKLWMFPTIGEDVLTFDKNGMGWRIEEIFVPYGSGAKEHRHPWGHQSFPATVQQEKNFYTFCGNTFELLKFSYVEKRIEAHFLFTDLQNIFRIYFQNLYEKKIWIEVEEYGLNNYISLIKDIPIYFIEKKCKKVGKKIFLKLKERISLK